jgi:hypothetical protein
MRGLHHCGERSKAIWNNLVAFRLLQLAFIFLLFENIAGKLRNDEESLGCCIFWVFAIAMTKTPWFWRKTKLE